MRSRFAPSPTGEAHPGTLLSALLVWLDARKQGGQVLLRLEDLDTTRVKAAWSEQMLEAFAWLGLHWDETLVQSGRTAAHEAALDQLAAAGRLYPCTCSRADRAGGRRAQLDDTRVELVDDGGLDLSQTPARDLGDPIVRRRDGVIAYQLAVVVDDADARITHVVRGRDIAPSTATQVMLQRLLGVPTPRYRHHLLLLEHAKGEKLAKLHGSIPFGELRARYRGDELVGVLAHAVGLIDDPAPRTPATLVEAFDWSRVRTADRVATFDCDRGLLVE